MARVLVVDDDPQIRGLLEIARRERPDILVLDNFMPGMSGIEACARIRADSVISSAWVILSSGKWSPDTMRQAYRSGVDDFLRRPFRLEELKGKLFNGRQQRKVKLLPV